MGNPLGRRTLLALFGGGGIAAAAETLRERSARADAAPAPLHSELGRIDPKVGAHVVHGDVPTAGSWRWQEGDCSAQVAADPLGGLTIRHDTIAPAKGAWVREWDGVHGRAAWFGTRRDDPAFDNQPAIQAALDLCPTVELGSGAYHVKRGLRIIRNGTRLIGAGITQTDQGDNANSSEIVCSHPGDTILQIGADGSGRPGKLVEAVQLAYFTVRRSVAPAIPTSGFEGAIGIALRWCVNCHIDRVFSIDSARGWHFYGTVENYLRYCSALRGIAGSRSATDFFIGYHLDYEAPSGMNGGNASLYLDHCRAFGGYGRGTPSLTYSAGLRTDGGWVDLFINALETGTLQYGIHANGDGLSNRISWRTEDLIITNCVLDPGTIAGIRIEGAGIASAIQISGCYSAVSASGTSIVLYNLAGSVTLTGNQCITGDVGGTGLSAVNVTNLRTSGNIFTKLKQPIYLERVTGFHIADSIRALDPGNTFPGVGLIGCTRGRVDCVITAQAGALTAGVEFKRAPSKGIEVNATAIDAGGGPRLVHMGAPVTAVGPFGTGHLATGLLA